MYSKRTGLILGFHGCDESVRDKVASVKGEIIHKSDHDYDWLGHGAYFWENNYERALQFAKELKKSPIKDKPIITKPSVIGAVIDLGFCLDLLDSEYLKILKLGYKTLVEMHKDLNWELPRNAPLRTGNDLLLRRLDCAVIEMIHQTNIDEEQSDFDSVRGVFFEGKELYPNAGFKEKNHIQIAVRNPNCIKGYFIPREKDKKYPKP